MKRKAALSLVAFAVGGLSLLVPATGSAGINVCGPDPVGCVEPPADPVCVVVTGPDGLHIQVGYAPNGPDGCQAIPLG